MKGQHNLFWFLAKTISGFTAWLLEVFSKDDGTDPGTEQLFFKPIAQKSAMVFRSITKVEGYLEVPVTTVLENEHGALILKQVGNQCLWSKPGCTMD